MNKEVYLLLIDKNLENIIINIQPDILYILIDDYSTILDKIKNLNLNIIDYCCLLGNFKIDDQLKNDANIINLDTLNQTNYTKYLNLKFNYTEHNIELNYNDVFTSSKPLISYINGIFKIENNNDLAIIIDNDGIYKINANKIGKYTIVISYTMDIGIELLENINLIINPVLKYSNYNFIKSVDEIISGKPTNQLDDGIFSLDCPINNITIDDKSGIIIITNNDVGIYKFIVTYSKNDCSTTNTFSLVVKPYISYDKYKNNITTSGKPLVKPEGGLFIIQNDINGITINNKTGELYFNNLQVKKYNIPIIYSINNSFVEYDYEINYLPTIDYEENNLVFDYNNINKVIKPILKPVGGYCKTDNENITCDFEGKLIFNNIIIGKNNFNIIYTVNNSFAKFNYTITFLPTITTNYTDFIYSDPISIDLLVSHTCTFSNKVGKPNSEVENFPGTFSNSEVENFPGTITINNDNFIINNSTIFNKEIIEPGIYNLLVTYNLNDISTTKDILITVLPKVSFTGNYETNISTGKTDEIIVSPPGGIFSINENVPKITIDSVTGILSYDNLDSGNYNIDVKYEINNVNQIMNYNIIIKPFIQYKSNILTLIHGLSDNYSDAPITNNNNFILISPTKLITINKDNGIIKFDKKLDIGSYSLKVNDIILTANIIPIINYNDIVINYGSYSESSKPSLSGLYILDNLIDGIDIDKNTGTIYFNKSATINVGQYNLVVTYKLNDITTKANINCKIVPTINYDTLIDNINYNSSFISSIPIVNPPGGKFTILYQKDQININNLGQINTSGLQIGKYELIVRYLFNDIYSDINHTINCIPSNILYSTNKTEIFYNDGGMSDIPSVLPSGGIFKIKNTPIGVMINKNGQLIFDKSIIVGNYMITVIYQIDSNFISTNYNLIVKPNFSYDNNILNYDKYIETDIPSVSYPDGYFEIFDNNLSIDRNTGKLTILDLNPATYNFNIKYTKNNVSTINSCKFIILPVFYYSDLNPVVKFGETFIIHAIVKPSTGIFLTNCPVLLGENGDLTISNLEIGNYNFKINYLYNNITVSSEINITVISNIFYVIQDLFYDEKSIIYPKNYIKQDGEQFISELPCQDGIITIDNLEIGNYNFKIDYLLNNVITSIDLSFRIIPNFYYEVSNFIITYGSLVTSDKPIVSYTNPECFFSLEYDFIEIDKETGILTIDNNLKLGKHALIINYNVNNIIIETTFNIEVKILFYYKDDTVIKSCDEIFIIDKPICNPSDGVFSSNKLPNNIILDSVTGLLSINSPLPVNEYLIDIIYTVTRSDINYFYKTIVTIISKPIIKYNNNLIGIYGSNYESELPIVEPLDGRFSSSIDLDILTGKITFDPLLEIDNYIFDIDYTVNSIVNNTKYYLNVIPFIEASVYHYQIKYGEQFIIDPPTVKPLNGKFKSLEYLNINEDTGEIIINNLTLGLHNIELIYIVNNNQNKINYTINVIPSLSYPIIHDKVIFKSNSLSIVPIINPPNGTFIRNNVALTGQIIFNNFNVGYHTLNIEYIHTRQKATFEYNFEIIPKFYYNIINYTNKYGNTLHSSKPIINPPGLLFNSDYSVNSNGIIDFSNLDVGNHEIKVFYGESVQIVTIMVTPIFNYDLNFIKLNYNEEITILPNIITPGGKFSSYDNEIVPDELTGLIDFSLIKPMDKSVTIYYELNSVITEQIISIECYPIINYTINKSILNYNIESHSILPELLPVGGIVRCKNLIEGISIDPNNGMIDIVNPKVGNYKLEIEYVYNNVVTNTYYYLSILPKIYYDNFIGYYNFDNQTCAPRIVSPNGIFSLTTNNLDIKINKYGVISFNKLTPIGKYIIQVNYSVNKQIINTEFECTIVPFIFYKNTKLMYGTIDEIKPVVYPYGGTFKISDSSLTIDINGKISNLSKLEPNRYNLIIEYNYIDVLYYSTFKLVIVPSLEINNNKIEYKPLNGSLQFSNPKLINMINNDIIISPIIGNYNLIVNYTYNNIVSKLNFELSNTVNKIYDTTKFNMYYDEILTINPIVNGIFSINQKIKGLTFNSSGAVIFNKPATGNYKLFINYECNNYTEIVEINIMVKPRFYYDIDSIEYGNNIIPIKYNYPPNGKFVFKNVYKNIEYNNLGTIYFNKAAPNKYEFNIDYIVNNSVESIKLIVTVRPILIFDKNLINVKHSAGFKTTDYIVNPYGGIFEIDNIKRESFIIDKNKNLGEHNISVFYKFNDIRSKLNDIKLVITPELYYPNNTININCLSVLYSDKPIVSPLNGIFSIDSDIVSINKNTGIITFDHVKLLNQKITVKYSIDGFTASTILNIIGNPILHYNQSLVINYCDNYEILTVKPFVYPEGGKYYIEDKNGTINNLTGELLFKNLDVGTYNIKVNYLINDINLFTIYNFIVNPHIEYSLSNVNIMDKYISKEPIVKPLGGIFSSNKLPNGITLDNKTGIISVNKIKPEIYNIIITYTYNKNSASTTLYFNII
uniref:Uncharacterized protein n=1 Tax=viral metagenome TaxID=1070528 RepID=A0A6C0DBR3_9ZZZZ